MNGNKMGLNQCITWGMAFISCSLFAHCQDALVTNQPCLKNWQPPAWSGPLKQDMPIEIVSDRADLSLHGQSRLSGEVCITQGPLQLRSESIDFNTENQDLMLNEAFTVSHPDLSLSAQSGQYNAQDTSLTVKNIEYQVHPLAGHGKAAHLSRDASGVITLKNASYSTCQNPGFGWQISSDLILLDPVKR